MVITTSVTLYDGEIKFNRCDLKMKIEVKTYSNNNQYYYIDYDWNYNSDIKDNPLYHDNEFISNHLDGDIVFKNPLTDNMVNVLMMNNEELSIYSNCNPLTYKLNIIKSLSLLWD
jgi:hypothetical protein